MAKTKRIFQIFSAAEPINPNGENPNSKSFNSKPKAMNQNNEAPALYPTSAGVKTNESETPDTNCSNDIALYPIEVQQAQQTNESTDKANAFKENLPEYKKICEKVLAADEVENNDSGVTPLMPPVIS